MLKPRIKFKRLINRSLRRSGLKRPFVATTSYADDVYCVSYPRSGNTWLRFMLAHLVCPPDAEIDFYNLDDYVPDVRSLDEHKAYPQPRIIKSHSPFQARYPRVVYLVRDGRDVYLSYYHFQQKKYTGPLSLADYLASNDHWPCRWQEHVLPWLDAGWGPERFLLVRYEDLKLDTTAELRRIVEFIGLVASETQIAAAVEQASFSNMRQIEEDSGHPRRKAFSGRFVRQGQSHGWEGAYGDQERAVFKARENEALLRLGYADTADW